LFILPEAFMSNTSEPFSVNPPSNPNGAAEKNGFRASFYPGFVSRLAVLGTDGVVTELYQQGGKENPFFLPPGVTRPWPTSTLAITGPDGNRIALQIEDPGQQIGRIEIYLKDANGGVRPSAISGGGDVSISGGMGGITGGVTADGDPPPPEPGGPVYICEDGPVLCPPMCPTQDGG
jgi:hypothetical protein